jgi:hypothetical protein
MIRLLLFSALAIVILSCENQPKEYVPGMAFERQIKEEIVSLNNSLRKESYLLYINRLDKEPRIQEEKVLENFGYESEEYKTIKEKISRTDIENLLRVEYYLEKYGYPDADSIGGLAVVTPIFILQHSPSYEKRVSYFDMIYKAYLDKDIEADLLVIYLDGLHQLKFNEFLKIDGPYQPIEKVDVLLEKLELKK